MGYRSPTIHSSVLRWQALQFRNRPLAKCRKHTETHVDTTMLAIATVITTAMIVAIIIRSFTGEK